MTAGASRRTATALPEVPGVLRAHEVLESAWWIAEVQRPDGMIPWFEGGHCDPWNQVEAAMALTVCRLLTEAERAFEWLARTQLSCGSWFNYYVADGVKDARLDTNVCAYVATGLWHHAVATGDTGLLDAHWPMLERAVDFVLRWQRPDGALRWSLDAAGRPESDALLTGSSSVYHSLRCALAAADLLDRPRPDWELAAGRLGHAIARHPLAFAPKDEFAMDWYYPVLCGAVAGDMARSRIASGWDVFVMEGLGVRCVSHNDWVTAAETAECALTLCALGEQGRAREVLASAQVMRRSDGSYWTGMVFPGEHTFPGSERTTYTAAAVILAADALADASRAAGIFLGAGLPAPVELPGPSCRAGDCRARVGDAPGG